MGKVLWQHFGLRPPDVALSDRHMHGVHHGNQHKTHKGATGQGGGFNELGLSPIGLMTLMVAPMLLYCAAKWMIEERKAEQAESRRKDMARLIEEGYAPKYPSKARFLR